MGDWWTRISGWDEWWVAVAIFGFVMASLWQCAGFVDRGVREEEGQFSSGQDYDPRRVRLATVHTRQDIVGLFYMLSTAVICLGAVTALIAAHVIHHW